MRVAQCSPFVGKVGTAGRRPGFLAALVATLRRPLELSRRIDPDLDLQMAPLAARRRRMFGMGRGGFVAAGMGSDFEVGAVAE
jgi:hypothetical protein